LIEPRCNYCGGKLQEKEIFLRKDKKYWCNSCLCTQKSRKMKCPGCNKKSLSFSYELTRTTIFCTATYCPATNLTFISHSHYHPDFPQIVGTIQNFNSEIIGFRNSGFKK